MLATLYRDDDIACLDKPSGLLVHRGWGNDESVLMDHAREITGCYVYPLHRLDRGASGVVVFALNKPAAQTMGRAFAGRTVHKTYLALVRGNPAAQIAIDHPLAARPGAERKPALTHIEKLEQLGRYAWVRARPETGRLHQIRRHLKHIACPLIGDVNYGKGEHNRYFREQFSLHRLALHAQQLAFAHPRTGQPIVVGSPVPAEIQHALSALRALVGPV